MKITKIYLTKRRGKAALTTFAVFHPADKFLGNVWKQDGAWTNNAFYPVTAKERRYFKTRKLAAEALMK